MVQIFFFSKEQKKEKSDFPFYISTFSIPSKG